MSLAPAPWWKEKESDLDRLLSSFSTDGKSFEALVKWFLQTDPQYASVLKHVWLWSEWPGRYGPDCGVDLVAETTDGALWAIQAKAYDRQYSVSKADVDSFLSESARAQFSYRLLVTTTNTIGRNAERTIQAQEKPVGLVRRVDLDRSAVDWASYRRLTVVEAVPAQEAKPHQQEAITAVLAGLERGDRGQCVMACGTGKTLVGLRVAEAVGGNALVLVPSLSLLKQVRGSWLANGLDPFSALAVCSDETVADDIHAADLGFPVSTDPDVVRAFLAGPGRRVVFCTYHSSPQLEGLTFDLAVADEAHRCAGGIHSAYATVLDNERIRVGKRLFMTATPRYVSGENAVSMDDSEVFGPVFHSLSFGEAIKRGLLCDYEVIISVVKESLYHRWVKDGRYVTYDGIYTTNARTLAGQIGVAQAMRDFDLGRVVSFHSRIQKAADFARTMPDVLEWLPEEMTPQGRFWSAHVSGEMSAGARATALHSFAAFDGTALLSNARVLGEGVDCPTIDCVAFIDPKGSMTDIIQAVGRAIRLSPDKSLGRVVVAVVVPDGEDENTTLEGSAFASVWTVLKALRAHDDILAESLRLARNAGKAGTGHQRMPAKIRLIGAEEITADFAEAFEARVIDLASQVMSWEYRYNELIAFVEANGRLPIQTESVWATNQRQHYRNGTLSQRRIALLEKVPGWVWLPHNEKWTDNFLRLKHFMESETSIPSDLQNWATIQRSAYASGELATERIEMLSRLNGWLWQVSHGKWTHNFELLREFVEREQRLPTSRAKDGPITGWVTKQRSIYNGTMTSPSGAVRTLTAEQIALLESIPGWCWEPKTDDFWESLWQERFSELQDYLATNGTYPSMKAELGRWINKQRTAYNTPDTRRRLTEQEVRQIETLPGWVWNEREAAWDSQYAELYEIMAVRQELCPPYKHSLGKWIDTQRRNHKTGKLSADRISRLEELPGWAWCAVSDLWDRWFTQVEQYLAVNGRYPTQKVPMIGAWVSTQRQGYRQGKLTNERIERLETLPDWKWKIK